MTPYTLRRIEPADKPVVESLLGTAWGAPQVYALALDTMIDASDLPGWLAEHDADVLGLLTYRPSDDLVDIITINTFRPGLGIGAALLARLDAPQIRVVTTTDNSHALRFYQRNGFRIVGHPADDKVDLRRSITAMGRNCT